MWPSANTRLLTRWMHAFVSQVLKVPSCMFTIHGYGHQEWSVVGSVGFLFPSFVVDIYSNFEVPGIRAPSSVVKPCRKGNYTRVTNNPCTHIQKIYTSRLYLNVTNSEVFYFSMKHIMAHSILICITFCTKLLVTHRGLNKIWQIYLNYIKIHNSFDLLCVRWFNIFPNNTLNCN